MLYVAKETFSAIIDGVPTMILEGRTLVDDSDDVYKRFAGNFKPAKSRFARLDVESATASPGEKRGAPA